jgi:hypothetical protein
MDIYGEIVGFVALLSLIYAVGVVIPQLLAADNDDWKQEAWEDMEKLKRKYRDDE